jgi:hypothetical protein
MGWAARDMVFVSFPFSAGILLWIPVRFSFSPGTQRRIYYPKITGTQKKVLSGKGTGPGVKLFPGSGTIFPANVFLDASDHGA